MQESFTRSEIIFTITLIIIGFTWPGALWLGSVIWERKKRAKRIKYMPLQQVPQNQRGQAETDICEDVHL